MIKRAYKKPSIKEKKVKLNSFLSTRGFEYAYSQIAGSTFAQMDPSNFSAGSSCFTDPNCA